MQTTELTPMASESGYILDDGGDLSFVVSATADCGVGAGAAWTRYGYLSCDASALPHGLRILQATLIVTGIESSGSADTWRYDVDVVDLDLDDLAGSLAQEERYQKVIALFGAPGSINWRILPIDDLTTDLPGPGTRRICFRLTDTGEGAEERLLLPETAKTSLLLGYEVVPTADVAAAIAPAGSATASLNRSAKAPIQSSFTVAAPMGES